MNIYLLWSGRLGAENTSTRLYMSQMQGGWYVDAFECFNYPLLAIFWIALSFTYLTFFFSFLFRTFYSALPYKWWSKFWHQTSQTTYRYSKVDADGKSTWLLCFTKWFSSCLEPKWVSTCWFCLSILSCRHEIEFHFFFLQTELLLRKK